MLPRRGISPGMTCLNRLRCYSLTHRHSFYSFGTSGRRVLLQVSIPTVTVYSILYQLSDRFLQGNSTVGGES